MENNPVIAENIRGHRIETIHRGSFALVDMHGTLQWGVGNFRNKVFPRSSAKVFQALAALNEDIIDEYHLTEQEIALLVSSHNGEDIHVETVKAIAEKAGITEKDFMCGHDYPWYKKDCLSTKFTQPSSFHHQCSGKHVALLMLAQKCGYTLHSYHEEHHNVQQRIIGLLEMMCDYHIAEKDSAIDGCSIPNWSLPLINLALGYAKFGTGEYLAEKTKKNAHKIMQSVWNNPLMIGGSNRHCSKIAKELKNHAFAKIGADGVYGAAFPEYGLGLAIKIDDGSAKASEVVLNHIMDKIGVLDDANIQHKDSWLRPKVNNIQGFETGYWRSTIDQT